ncbi:MAG: hypothetical protein ACRCYS_15840, partial [Beijerinckiaceae bacterium]
MQKTVAILSSRKIMQNNPIENQLQDVVRNGLARTNWRDPVTRQRYFAAIRPKVDSFIVARFAGTVDHARISSTLHDFIDDLERRAANGDAELDGSSTAPENNVETERLGDTPPHAEPRADIPESAQGTHSGPPGLGRMLAAALVAGALGAGTAVYALRILGDRVPGES